MMTTPHLMIGTEVAEERRALGMKYRKIGFSDQHKSWSFLDI
jgi:hypothetical protein